MPTCFPHQSTCMISVFFSFILSCLVFSSISSSLLSLSLSSFSYFSLSIFLSILSPCDVMCVSVLCVAVCVCCVLCVSLCVCGGWWCVPCGCGTLRTPVCRLKTASMCTFETSRVCRHTTRTCVSRHVQKQRSPIAVHMKLFSKKRRVDSNVLMQLNVH